MLEPDRPAIIEIMPDATAIYVESSDREKAHCPVCDGTPRVLVAIHHPAMRELTSELLERECACWVAREISEDQRLAEAIAEHDPDLLVVDAHDFPACCQAALRSFRRDRVIVIGPEPDQAYQAAALAGGAGSWIPRDRVGEDLAGEMRRVLGCIHHPCPPAAHAGAGPTRTTQSRA